MDPTLSVEEALPIRDRENALVAAGVKEVVAARRVQCLGDVIFGIPKNRMT